jgi:hypothetical protein
MEIFSVVAKAVNEKVIALDATDGTFNQYIHVTQSFVVSSAVGVS